MVPRPDEERRRAALEAAFAAGLAGQPHALYTFLARHSHLPSPRANEGLMEEVAELAAGHGKKADRLLVAMATLDADLALGGTEFEFVPMCGVLGLALRAARDDDAYPKLLPVLHTAAEDLRYRVRDVVPQALARLGATRGDGLLEAVEPWMDGFFHAAAVLLALGQPGWLTAVHRGDLAAQRLDQAFALARGASRSASRYPGYKALLDALAVTPGLVAARFGVPIFDTLEGWTKEKEPALREVVEKNLRSPRLAGRHAADIERVQRALAASAPVRRDPNTYVGPTRNRSRGRKKG
mgnify:CR=1 FL=1